MSQAVENLIQGIKTKTVFANEIGQGNYEKEFHLLSKNDSMGLALMEMRDKLVKNKEEDNKRNWATSGIAQIGEILRTNTNYSSVLYNNIISFAVKYLDANQGGLFLLNDVNEKDRYLELVSCYAYSKKKFLEKKVDLGEGLLGQCFLEKDIIYMTNVPDMHTSITSGLGEATPNCIILCPLKINEEVNGVIEIASFKKFEKHQIDFIIKLSESVASVISNLRVSERTSRLLSQTQQQSEEMRAQEEEMRQNLEELQATQEEFERKEQAYIEEINSLKQHS